VTLGEVLRGDTRHSEEDYQSAVKGALRRVLAATEVSRPPAPTHLLLAELDRQPEVRRETIARNLARFHSVELLERIVERSFAERYRDVGRMLTDARLATRIADALSLDKGRLDTRAADAILGAWCQWGNALRVAGRLAEADEAFGRALELLAQLPSSLGATALVCDRLATLRKDQRHFAQAHELFERAVEIYRVAKDGPRLGRTLLNLALNRALSGDPSGTLDGILEAAPLLDVRAEPSLALAALIATVRAYIDDNQPERALSTFMLGQELFRTKQSPLATLKVQWTEGHLLASLRHFDAARHLLEEARASYIAAGHHYNCALVSLDLAMVLAQMGHFTEVRSLIAQSLPIFAALAVHREILASFILLSRADDQANTLAMLRELASRLERDPTALNLAAVR
jgi:tetratricopeptide (TPR) repeat protein